MGNCCCKSGAAGAVAAAQTDGTDGTAGLGTGTGRSSLGKVSSVNNGRQPSVLSKCQWQVPVVCADAVLMCLALCRLARGQVGLALGLLTQAMVPWKARPR